MRFRKKHFAIPEMEKSPHVLLSVDEKEKDWSLYFAKADQPIHLELGAGRGRFLCEMAKKNPEINYLGIDIEPNAMIVAKRLMDSMELKNVLLLRHDISRVEGIFPSQSIEKLYIHFPNPWPKKRHYKRRLTHPRQLIQYHSFLQDGAEVQFKTDDLELYEASLDYFPRMGFRIQSHTPDLAIEDDKCQIITEYEERWRKEGMQIKAIYAVKESIPEKELEEAFDLFLEEEKLYRSQNPRSEFRPRT